MNHKERMLKGLPYKASLDGLKEARIEVRLKTYEYNLIRPDEHEKMDKVIRSIVGVAGENIFIEQPFRCDYGSNIEIGDNFYANFNCVILDVAKVKIGDNVMFGPNVSIYTAGHPLHHDSRNSGYEYGVEVVIGNNTWIGGGSIINPGVTIGNNVVIGSGSVVTKDIEDNVIAIGNPCKVLRNITEEDRKYYYKNYEFDIDDYNI